MTTLLYKPYLVKVSMKGGMESKIPKNLSTRFMNGPNIAAHLESEAKKSALTFLCFKTLILMIVLFCVYVLKVDTLRIPKW